MVKFDGKVDLEDVEIKEVVSGIEMAMATGAGGPMGGGGRHAMLAGCCCHHIQWGAQWRWQRQLGRRGWQILGGWSSHKVG